jgi:hypothetical protein
MAINNPEITAIEHALDTSTAIEVSLERPPSTVLDTPVISGRLLGYYDSSADAVSLYVSDQNGLRWLPVTFNG